MSISLAHDTPATAELSLKTWHLFLLILLANLQVQLPVVFQVLF